MKDKIIDALSTEYEAVYLIDLENDTYKTLKMFDASPAMRSSNRWSEAVKAFEEECSEDSRAIIRLCSDGTLLQSSLLKDDYREFTFRHTLSGSGLRKVYAHIIKYNDKMPSIILLTVSEIDKLKNQKEKLFQKLLSTDNNGNYNKDSSELSTYKTLISDNADDSNGLFDGIRILFVEDNEILRMISKRTLENEGAVVTEAENGQVAVDMIENGNIFDFIIMDIVMPVLDGIEATRRITDYQHAHGTSIPVLGLTGDAADCQIKQITEAGAYACLSKPLNPVEISKVFISCMREKAVLMEEKMAEINLLANTDMLTQTGNIVAYTHDIAKLTEKMHKQKLNVAIVICDLDNLKGINDTYGHDVGDIYIKNCCALIGKIFDKQPLYRIGGDEFALIIKDTGLLDIDKCIKTLNDKSREYSSGKEVVNGRASVSAGYATYNADIDESLSDTMKRADVAMYETKQIHRKWSETYSKMR